MRNIEVKPCTEETNKALGRWKVIDGHSLHVFNSQKEAEDWAEGQRKVTSD